MATRRRKKEKKKDETPTERAPWAERHPEVKGFLFMVAAVLLGLSMWSFADTATSQNWLGLIGKASGWTLNFVFGGAGYLIVMYSGWLGLRMLSGPPIAKLRAHVIAFAAFLFSSCILFNLLFDQWQLLRDWLSTTLYATPQGQAWHEMYHFGGTPFHYLYRDLPYGNLLHLLNVAGIGIVFGGIAVASLLFMANVDLKRAVEVIKRPAPEDSEETSASKIPEPTFNVDDGEKVSLFQRIKTGIATRLEKRAAAKAEPVITVADEETGATSSAATTPMDTTPEAQFDTLEKRVPRRAGESKAADEPVSQDRRAAAIDAQRVWNGDYRKYKLPKAHLLTTPKKVDQSTLKKDLRQQAEVLEETLLSFGIEAKVGQINCGPTITSFEVHPAVGVKVQRIKALENDIALNMQAQSIRIIAPIPGKAAVGIEIPNPHPQEVGFKELLSAYQRGGTEYKIPVLLGKTVNGDQVMADLAKMPHCIIAGATGSGKSVCINTIVMSIVMTAKPDEIRLLMVDPKKVELSGYTRLPHMLAPVITEPGEACAALNWLVKEMETRYELLKQVGVRNIDSFNKRKPNLAAENEIEKSLGYPLPEKLPYIVGIIDELADLMMVASSDIETPIARIAQMARAVGIHLILATQRPSREVITGLIKANFPTRISFKVASRINSQIVIDDTGAEMLLGNGDMLFLPPGTSTLVRAQGAFIRDEDIRAIIKMTTDQAPPVYVTESFENMSLSSSRGSSSASDLDSLYDDAYKVVTGTGNASTTFLQRKLKIGYARAASIMDQLHEQGVVGPAEGSKPRKILVAVGGGEDDEDFHGIE